MINLGDGSAPPRSLARMARHRITTDSLLQDIERQRAEEAASRWDELSREFMQEDAPEGSDANSDADADAEQPVR